MSVGGKEGSGFTHAYNTEPITFHPDYAHDGEMPVSYTVTSILFGGVGPGGKNGYGCDVITFSSVLSCTCVHCQWCHNAGVIRLYQAIHANVHNFLANIIVLLCIKYL